MSKRRNLAEAIAEPDEQPAAAAGQATPPAPEAVTLAGPKPSVWKQALTS